MFVFNKYCFKSRLGPNLGRFGVDLGAQKEPKWHPRRNKKQSKIIFKSHQHVNRFLKKTMVRTSHPKPEQLKTESADGVRQSKPMTECSR